MVSLSSMTTMPHGWRTCWTSRRKNSGGSRSASTRPTICRSPRHASRELLPQPKIRSQSGILRDCAVRRVLTSSSMPGSACVVSAAPVIPALPYPGYEREVGSRRHPLPTSRTRQKRSASPACPNILSMSERPSGKASSTSSAPPTSFAFRHISANQKVSMHWKRWPPDCRWWAPTTARFRP